jgi:O-antigen/teichoic acid export membrane protein
VLVAVLAQDLMVVMLGSQWLEAAPFMVYVALAGGITSFNISVSSVFNAVGQPKRVAIQDWTRALVMVPCIYAGMRLGGPLGITQAMLAASAALTPMFFIQVARVIPLGPRMLLEVVWRPLAAAAAMAACVLMVQAATASAPTPVRLLGAGLAGALAYLATLFLLWRLAGRPGGAEAAMLSMGGRLLGGLRRP